MDVASLLLMRVHKSAFQSVFSMVGINAYTFLDGHRNVIGAVKFSSVIPTGFLLKSHMLVKLCTCI